MATPGDIRLGLAHNLRSLPWQISPYVLDSPNPPTVYIASGPVQYDQTMDDRSMGQKGRHDDWTFVIFALVGYVSDVGAQMTLDDMLATGTAMSVKDLAESDRTLGGAATSVRVESVTGARVYTLGGPNVSAPVIGAEWTVMVMASAA